MGSRTEYGIKLWMGICILNGCPHIVKGAEQKQRAMQEQAMREYPVRTSHRLRPVPSGRWVMTQRWNDLLFAHWPVPASSLAALLPDGLQVDTFAGSAWLGVVPFCMDRIRLRGLPSIPGTRSFPELNLRTYVRDPKTGTSGVFFLSLDAGNLLAVAFARSMYSLPYYW